MKKFVVLLLIAIVVFIALGYYFGLSFKSKANYGQATSIFIKQMLLTSSSFNDGEYVPTKFTCDSSVSVAGGEDINPELIIQNVPKETKSLALIMDDPDAPIGNFTHWLLWNINPNTTTIKQESVPPGSVEGKNSAGKIGYIGPCPPPGKPHRYFFKLHALGAMLDIPGDAQKEVLEKEIKRHLIAETQLMGLYERK